MTQYIPIYMHTHHKINDIINQQEFRPVYIQCENIQSKNMNENDEIIDNGVNPLDEKLKNILIILIILFLFFMGVSGAIIHYNTKNTTL
jgi:Cu/Ag efflux pump CusA